MGEIAIPLRATGLSIFVLCLSLTGCQYGASVSSAALVEHRSQVDPTGLRPLETVDLVKASCAWPADWLTMPSQRSTFYTHQQWRSPTKRTATGVAYIRMPLPLTSKTVAWFATREYAKRAKDGRIVAQWRDGFGREWFEAENDKFRIRGFIIVRNFEAWVSYSGYRRHEDRDEAEVALGERALETVVPFTKAPPVGNGGLVAVTDMK